MSKDYWQEFTSPFRGVSVEFAEHREYVPGDDSPCGLESGRTDKLYKQFVDETNLHCCVLVDSSPVCTTALRVG